MHHRTSIGRFLLLASSAVATIATASFADTNPAKRNAAGGVAGSSCSCPGDMNLDGVIDAADLSMLLGAWGTNDILADVNADGTVDAADLSLTLGAWGACGAPVNDLCSDSLTLELGETVFCTSSATTTPNYSLSNCGVASTMYNDIWYDYTPAGDGKLTVSTCGDAEFDTVLAAYSGILPGLGACPTQDGGIGLVSLIACNDDTDNCPGNTSKMTFDVSAGFNYKIRVGGYSASAKGTGSLNTSFQSVGDACYHAIPTDEDLILITVSGTTVDNPYGVPAECGTSPESSRSEWIVWECPCNEALVSVSTCNPGTNFDTVVEVWRQGLDGCTAFLEACDDDSGCGTTSATDFYANYGEVFFIRVTGYFASSAGDYELTIGKECIN